MHIYAGWAPSPNGSQGTPGGTPGGSGAGHPPPHLNPPSAKRPRSAGPSNLGLHPSPGGGGVGVLQASPGGVSKGVLGGVGMGGVGGVGGVGIGPPSGLPPLGSGQALSDAAAVGKVSGTLAIKKY